MAHRKLDIVQEISTSVGTGAMTLGGAVMGHRTFAGAGMANGDTCHVRIAHGTLNESEVCLAAYVSASNSLTRGRMISSTTGLVVNFSAGPKTISMVAPADRMVVMDESGHAAIEGVLTAVGVTIDRAAGAFRALQFLTAGSLRWVLQVTGAADNFDIRRYDDAGAFAGVGFWIDRANGAVAFGATNGFPQYSIYAARQITGGTTAVALGLNSVIQPDVTVAEYVRATIQTAAGANPFEHDGLPRHARHDGRRAVDAGRLLRRQHDDRRELELQFLRQPARRCRSMERLHGRPRRKLSQRPVLLPLCADDGECCERFPRQRQLARQLAAPLDIVAALQAQRRAARQRARRCCCQQSPTHRYRSRSPADNPDWSWYGLAAEELAEIDARLVTWGYKADDFEEYELMPAHPGDEAAGIAPTERVMQQRVREGAVKALMASITDGRRSCSSTLVRWQGERIAALEARMAD